MAVVHWSRSGHAPQVTPATLTTILSVPCWVHGLQEELTWPCGQVARRDCQSMVNAATWNPALPLAWTEVSSRTGVISAMP